MDCCDSNIDRYGRCGHHHHYPTSFMGTPTIYPSNPFNPELDAEILRRAMRGLGTDEKAIINLLTNRTNFQRLEISHHFKRMYNKDLIQNLKSELSGHFEDVIIAMMTPYHQYYANELHRAIHGIGTDEDILIEILCTMPNQELRNIRRIYHETFGKTLEHDLKRDTSGTFRQMLITLCNSYRDESMEINHQTALIDAENLLKSGEFCLTNEKSTFYIILCERNVLQLRLIFDQYKNISGNDIENTIRNEFHGDTKHCMLAIVHAVRNKHEFFAECLHKYMKGLGTHDKNLIRVIVTRSEIDLEDVKKIFHSLYGISLRDKIKHECSGDYKRCLLGLLGD